MDTRGTRSEIETLKLKVMQDERTESNQYASLQKLNGKYMNKNTKLKEGLENLMRYIIGPKC